MKKRLISAAQMVRACALQARYHLQVALRSKKLLCCPPDEFDELEAEMLEEVAELEARAERRGWTDPA